MPASIPASIVLATLLGAALPGDRATSDGASPLRPGGTPTVPPPRAAAQITPGSGACLMFLSVYVPAQDGRYAVGISFTFRDLDHNGVYTPGADKLEVCVNCDDACDWGP